MSSGQSLLSLGAVVLLSYMALNVNRVYVSSVGETSKYQQSLDAINFAQSLSDAIYAHSSNYDKIDQIYGAYNNINQKNSRLSIYTPLGDSLHATVTFSAAQPVADGVTGRIATIRIYNRLDGTYNQLVESTATLVQME
jgi:hypothetical protein